MSRYANRARNIKNKPVKNLDANSAQVAALKQQLELLKAQLLGQGLTPCVGSAANAASAADMNRHGAGSAQAASFGGGEGERVAQLLQEINVTVADLSCMPLEPM